MRRIQSFLAVLLVIGLVFGVTYQAEAQRTTTLDTDSDRAGTVALSDTVVLSTTKTPVDLVLAYDTSSAVALLTFYFENDTASGSGITMKGGDPPLYIPNVRSAFLRRKSNTANAWLPNRVRVITK